MGFAVNGYGFPADDRQLFLCNGQEFAHIETHAEYGERAAQHAVLHIEFDGEAGNVVFRQVHFLPVDKDSDFTEIERVDGFAEIFGIAVFPPADAGFVGEPHAGDVGAQVAVGRVGFLKAAAHTHIAVAQAGQALLQPFVFFFQFCRTQRPRADFHDSCIHRKAPVLMVLWQTVLKYGSSYLNQIKRRQKFQTTLLPINEENYAPPCVSLIRNTENAPSSRTTPPTKNILACKPPIIGNNMKLNSEATI